MQNFETFLSGTILIRRYCQVFYQKLLNLHYKKRQSKYKKKYKIKVDWSNALSMREQLPLKQTNNAYDSEQYEKCQGEDIFYPKNIE